MSTSLSALVNYKDGSTVVNLPPKVQITLVIIAALAFLIAFAWSRFLDEWFRTYIAPADKNLSNFLYAIFATIIVIVIIFVLFKFIVDKP